MKNANAAANHRQASRGDLLNLVAGLDAPTAGTATASGRCALMFQDAALFPWLTVQANVELPLELHLGGIGQLAIFYRPPAKTDA